MAIKCNYDILFFISTSIILIKKLYSHKYKNEIFKILKNRAKYLL
jgi:hypothetical protein